MNDVLIINGLKPYDIDTRIIKLSISPLENIIQTFFVYISQNWVNTDVTI